MWLLSTDRAELHSFHSPDIIPGGYAILSHVWGENEQTFQEIQQLQIACATSSVDLIAHHKYGPAMSLNPRDHVCEKIRKTCLVAESYGYNWVWNDTCCIDKSSSSELSEAINSMFRYYALAEVCLAYLADVPSSASFAGTSPEFRDSRWHKRGWTLQELIAPSFLVFLSRDWTYLGSKHELAPPLESITQIPAAVLRNEEEPSRFSIAQRMSWAKGRETTRVEDRAYSLLGIFQINMNTLYGEGPRAFVRLQEKIMKTSIDTTIFAWGLRLTWKSFSQVIETYPHHHAHPIPDLYLLSTSPQEFSRARGIRFDSSCSSLATFSEVLYDVSLTRNTLLRTVKARRYWEKSEAAQQLILLRAYLYTHILHDSLRCCMSHCGFRDSVILRGDALLLRR